MVHQSIIGHISSPSERPAIPDTVMVLLLINQPVLDAVEDLSARTALQPQSLHFILRRPVRDALYLSGVSTRYQG